jgi:hypothetical protein
MKFKKQRDEEERLERAAKIKAHLAKTQAGTPKADTKAAGDGSANSAPKASVGVWPPLRPWQRLNRWGRREQYRPLTSAEHDAVQDEILLKKCFDEDQAYREKVRKAEAEEEAEQKATRKRAEHEARTGMRPYEPGRYCSVEEARRKGYLGGGTDDRTGNDWSSPGNPDGLMGGGR